MKSNTFRAFFLISIFSLNAFSQSEPDELASTQELLRNPEKRSAVIKEGGQALKADQFIDQAFGNDPAMKQQLYDAAADMMKSLESQAQKDPAKMNEILSKAANNPSAFLDSLSPEQKAKIRGLANQAESKKTSPNQKP